MVEAVTSSIVEATWRLLLLHLGWARQLLWAAATSACWKDVEKVQGVAASRVVWWEGVFGTAPFLFLDVRWRRCFVADS
jgi:hypothetical protein